MFKGWLDYVPRKTRLDLYVLTINLVQNIQTQTPSRVKKMYNVFGVM